MNDEVLQILNQQSLAIGRIEGSLKELVGNGKPGLVQEMRDDIDDLKETRANAKGYAAGFTAALAVADGLLHYVFHKLSGN